MPELNKYMDRKLSLQLNGNRKIVGVLRGYDAFLNLVLDDCFEHTATEQIPVGMSVIRGNSVIAMEALEKIF